MSLRRTLSFARPSRYSSRGRLFKWENQLRRSLYSQQERKAKSCGRRLVAEIVSSQLFQGTITLCIVLNSCFLAGYNPSQANDEGFNKFIEDSEWFFQGVFTIEAIMLIYHLGRRYFHSYANGFDFSLVLLGWVVIIVVAIEEDYRGSINIASFRMLRSLRILRGLRLLKFVPGMTILVNMVKGAAAHLRAVLIFAGFILLAYSILGVQLFMDVSPTNVPGPATGVARIIGFENIFQGFTTIFVAFSREGWVEIMNWVQAERPFSFIFFFSLTAVGSLLVLNLLVTVLVTNHMDTNVKRPLGYQLQYKLESTVQRAIERSKDVRVYDIDDAKMRLMVSFERRRKRGGPNVISRKEYKEWMTEFGPLYEEWKMLHELLEPAKHEVPEEEHEPQPAVQPAEVEDSSRREQHELWIPQTYKVELFFFLVALYNTTLLAFVYFLQPLYLNQLVGISAYVCGSIFFVEAFCRVFWNGSPRDWIYRSKRENLDFVFVMVAFMLQVIPPGFPSLLAFKMFSPRNLVVLLSEEVKRRRAENKPLNTFILWLEGKRKKYFQETWMLSKRAVLVQSSLRSVAPFAMVVFIYLHVFAVAGLYMFGGLDKTGVYGKVGSLGYDNYIAAMVTTFQLLTGEGWNTVMYSSVEVFAKLDASSGTVSNGNVTQSVEGANQVNVVLAVAYHITGTAIGNLLLLKLVLAILLDSYFAYSALMERKKLRENMPKQIDCLKEKLEQKRSLLLEQRKVSKRFLSLQSLAMSSESESREKPAEGAWFASLQGGMAKRLSDVVAVIEEYHVVDKVGWIWVSIYCIANLFPASPEKSVVVAICIAFFTAELFVRAIADYVMERLSPYILFDLLALLCAYLGFLLDMPVTTALQSIVALRFIRFSRELRVICVSLSKSAIGCLIVLSYSFVVITVFSIFSVDLLGGRFRDCVDKQTFEVVPVVLNKTCFSFTGLPEAQQYKLETCAPVNECVGPGLTWANPKRNNLSGSDFDSYGSAMQAIWEIGTLQLWNEVMYQASRVTSIGQSPMDGASLYMGGYFSFLVVITHVFLLQLFVTNVIKMFLTMERKETGDEFLTDNQRLWVENQIRVIFQRPRQASPQHSRCRSAVFRCVDSKLFESIIMLCVIIDTVLLMLQHKNQPQEITMVIDVSTYVFGGIYIVEACLKIYAYGRDYFRSVRHLFDFTIAGFAFLEILAISNVITKGVIPNLTSLRMLRLLGVVPTLRILLKVLGSSILSFAPVVMLFLLLLYIFCIIGTALFQGSEFFNTSGAALSTLYILAIGDDWNLVMRKVEAELPHLKLIVRGYCVAVVFLVTLTVVNLLIVVMLQVFEQEFLRKALSQGSLDEYRREWYKSFWNFRQGLEQRLHRGSVQSFAEIGGSSGLFRELTNRITNTSYLPPESFPSLLAKLKPPLGIVDFAQGDFTVVETLQLIHLAKIPLTKSNMVNYNSALFALSDFRYKVNTGEEISDELKLVGLKLYFQRNRFKYSLLGQCFHSEAPEHFESMFQESNSTYYLSHYLAAKMIQTAYRLWKLNPTREANIMRNTILNFGWNESRKRKSVRFSLFETSSSKPHTTVEDNLLTLSDTDSETGSSHEVKDSNLDIALV